MKLPLVFVGIFFGVIVAVAGLVATLKAAGKFIDWLKVKSGRSETEITMAMYVVLMALVIAGGMTAAIAAGGSK